MNMRNTIRAAVAVAVAAGGLLTMAGPASAATAGAYNYITLAPNSSATLRLSCYSYAPTMLIGTIAFSTRGGAAVAGYTVDTTSDAYSRDLLKATVVNNSSTSGSVTVTAVCSS
jgi:hypothetical protein